MVFSKSKWVFREIDNDRAELKPVVPAKLTKLADVGILMVVAVLGLTHVF